MSLADRAPPLVLEPIQRTHTTSDANDRRSEIGRLILAADALHWVQGWEVTGRIDNGYTPFGLLDNLFRRLFPHTWADGLRLLAEVEALPPAEQVRSMSGSLTVPVTDIESARLSLLPIDLTVVTDARGEVLTFQIPLRRRGAVKAWLAGLPRR